MFTVFTAQELRAAVHHRPVEKALEREGHGERAGARVAGADDLQGPRPVLRNGGGCAHCWCRSASWRKGPGSISILVPCYRGCGVSD